MAPIFASREVPVGYTAFKLKSLPSFATSFHLVPYLPRIVAMVAKFFYV